MAVLTEEDQRNILGMNFREQMAEADRASGIKAGERNKQAEIASMDERRTLGGYAAAVGLVLMLASWFTVTGQTFLVQTGIGAAIFVLGLATSMHSHSKGRAARVQLSALE